MSDYIVQKYKNNEYFNDDKKIIPMNLRFRKQWSILQNEWNKIASVIDNDLQVGDKNSMCRGVIDNTYLNEDQISKNAIIFTVKNKKEDNIEAFAVCRFKKTQILREDKDRPIQYYLYIDVICSRSRMSTQLLWKSILCFIKDNTFILSGIQLSALTYVVGYYYKLGFRFYNIDIEGAEKDKLDSKANDTSYELSTMRFNRNDDRDPAFLNDPMNNKPGGVADKILNFIDAAQSHSVQFEELGSGRRMPPKTRSMRRSMGTTMKRQDPGGEGWTMFLKNNKNLTGTQFQYLTKLMNKYCPRTQIYKVDLKKDLSDLSSSTSDINYHIQPDAVTEPAPEITNEMLGGKKTKRKTKRKHRKNKKKNKTKRRNKKNNKLTKTKCSRKRLRKKMICFKGSKKNLALLNKYTKKMNVRLTRCSRKRMKSYI
jgi:hypothetical protein